MAHLALKKSSFYFKYMYWYFCLFHLEEQCLPWIHLYCGVFDFFCNSTNTAFKQLGSNLICCDGHLLILFLLWCLQEEINAFSSISWHNLGIVMTWIFSSWIKYRFQTKVLFMLFGLKMMYSLVNIYNQ